MQGSSTRFFPADRVPSESHLCLKDACPTFLRCPASRRPARKFDCPQSPFQRCWRRVAASICCSWRSRTLLLVRGHRRQLGLPQMESAILLPEQCDLGGRGQMSILTVAMSTSTAAMSTPTVAVSMFAAAMSTSTVAMSISTAVVFAGDDRAIAPSGQALAAIARSGGTLAATPAPSIPKQHAPGDRKPGGKIEPTCTDPKIK